MFLKAKELNKYAIDNNLYSICNDLLKCNRTALFALKKDFIKKGDSNIYEELKTDKIIYSSLPVNELNIPSYYKLKNNYLTLWDEKAPIAKIVFSEISFSDSEKTLKNGTKVKKLNFNYED